MLIQLKSAGRRHPDKRSWLLRDISLSVERGERIAILGRSGSGKTLVLRSLCALDPLDVGELLWNDEPLSRRRIPSFRRTAVYLHQRPAFIAGTVQQNLLLPFRLHSKTTEQRFDLHRAATLFEMLGFNAELLDHPITNLSGGEQQAVALVRAMQLDPTLLLLDEPTASIDSESALAVESVITEWLTESNERSAVWITHSQDQADRFATRHVRLNQGRLEPTS